jgi:hypothetical protein
MNTINKILGKDISSIIFKYLTVNIHVIKNEYSKNIKYFEYAFQYCNQNSIISLPSFIVEDNKFIEVYHYWDSNKNKWRYKFE